jgi:carboxymethylenebutenolidase
VRNLSALAPRRDSFVLIVSLLVLLSCKKAEDAAPNPPAKPSAAASPAAATSGTRGAPSEGATGALSEEEFKRIHELKTDKAPPRKGSAIKLGSERAYLSLPPGAAPPVPGVVVIHEWWGLNEHIMHWADRLAADGYAALAVDLYEGKVATTPDEAMAGMKSVDDARATKTLLAAHDFLERDPRVQAKRTGVIGWCFGGKWALELALAEPDLEAAVVYYGHVTTDPKRLAKLRAPLFGVFANRDQAITPALVDDFEKTLRGQGKQVTIVRYDADHAFANPSGQRYDAKAAEDAWRQVRDFLARELKQQS